MKENNLAEELETRGLIEQAGGGAVEEILSESQKAYLGIDPSADSLHVGNLAQILFMRRLAEGGHDVIFLVGGGTGMIGDPRESGERTLLDEETINANADALQKQLSQIIGKEIKIVNNADWLKKLGMLEFLRDVGKHFTVNQLIKRDIIKRRLETEEDSISYTEFSYSLLQAYDFWHLFKEYDVNLQVGGSDQWANIISGVDLIRRKEGKQAYALTTPIIVDKKTGKKFGKSEGNAVWLDAKKTSPFAFYQYWFNLADEGIEEYLKIFTFLTLQEIEAVMEEQKTDPSKRVAQARLAYAVTALVHGEKEAEKAKGQSEAMFGDEAAIPEEMMIPFKRSRLNEGFSIIDLLVESNFVTSKSEARRLIQAGGVSLNEGRITDTDLVVTEEHFKDGALILKKGKRAVQAFRLMD